jgi:hypothetical protein
MTASPTWMLFDLLGERSRECLSRGWPEVPEWVFSSQAGTALAPRNVERVWYRLRRKAQKAGVRPLPLHSARHTWPTLALRAGKNIRWVADQLGHADLALTIRVYAHAMWEDEADLSFSEFGVPGRPYAALGSEDEIAGAANLAISMARPARPASEPSARKLVFSRHIHLPEARGSQSPNGRYVARPEKLERTTLSSARRKRDEE